MPPFELEAVRELTELEKHALKGVFYYGPDKGKSEVARGLAALDNSFETPVDVGELFVELPGKLAASVPPEVPSE